MDDLFRDFLVESAAQLEAIEAQLNRIAIDCGNPQVSVGVCCLIHAISSASGLLGLRRLQKLAKAAEALTLKMGDDDVSNRETLPLIRKAIAAMRAALVALGAQGLQLAGDDRNLIAHVNSSTIAGKPQPACGSRDDPVTPPPQTGAGEKIDAVRVPGQSLESMTALVCEIALTRDQLLGPTTDEALQSKMWPLARAFARLRRMERQTAAETGKKVELMEGGSGRLDRQFFPRLFEAIVAVKMRVGGSSLPPATLGGRILARNDGSLLASVEEAGEPATISADAEQNATTMPRIPATRFPAVVSIESRSDGPPRTRLLVIETVRLFHRMLEQTLLQAGYEVDFAANFDEALQVLERSRPYDGLLADFEDGSVNRSPDKSRDVFPPASAVRRLALSSHNGEGLQSAARRAGFEAAVCKFDRRNIVEGLRAVGLEPECAKAAA